MYVLLGCYRFGGIYCFTSFVKVVRAVVLLCKMGRTGLSHGVRTGPEYHLLLTSLPSGRREDVHCLFDLMQVGVAQRIQILHLSITVIAI